jgi:hypothetical protein
MHDVLILFLHLIVTVVRLPESVAAPNAPGNAGESVIEKCSMRLGEVKSSGGGREVIRTHNPLPLNSRW